MNKERDSLTEIKQLIAKNPTEQFYARLEEIVNTPLPRFRSHQTVLKSITKQLEEVKEYAHKLRHAEVDNSVLSELHQRVYNDFFWIYALESFGKFSQKLEEWGQNFFGHKKNEVANEKSPKAIAKKKLEDLSDYLTKTQREVDSVNEYLEELNRICVFTTDTLRIVGNTIDEYGNKALLARGATDYKEMLVIVRKNLREEYHEFRSDPELYVKTKEEQLLEEMRKVAGKPPQSSVVPPDNPSAPLGITLH